MSHMSALKSPFRIGKSGVFPMILAGLVIGVVALKSLVLAVGILCAAIAVGLSLRSPLAAWLLLIINMLFTSNYYHPPYSTVAFWGLTVLLILSVAWQWLHSEGGIVLGDRFFWTAFIGWFLWGCVSAAFNPDWAISIREMGRYGIMLSLLFAYVQWFTDEGSVRVVLRCLWVCLCCYAVLMIVRTFLAGHGVSALLGSHWHSQPESASYYVAFIPLFLSLLKHLRGRTRASWFWLAVFCGVTVVSNSATAMLSAAVGILAFYALLKPKAAGRVTVFGLLALLGVFLLGSLYIHGFHDLLVYQMSGRERIWPAAVQAAATHPLLGVGPGRWSQWFGAHYFIADFIFDDFQGNTFTLDPSTLDGQAHNLFLTKAAEMGLPSLVLLMAVFVLWYRKAFDVYRSLPDGWPRDLVRGCLASFIGLTFFCVFENGPIIGTAREGEVLFVTMIMALPFAVEHWHKGAEEQQ